MLTKNPIKLFFRPQFITVYAEVAILLFHCGFCCILYKELRDIDESNRDNTVQWPGSRPDP